MLNLSNYPFFSYLPPTWAHLFFLTQFSLENLIKTFIYHQSPGFDRRRKSFFQENIYHENILTNVRRNPKANFRKTLVEWGKNNKSIISQFSIVNAAKPTGTPFGRERKQVSACQKFSNRDTFAVSSKNIFNVHQKHLQRPLSPPMASLELKSQKFIKIY